jgi:hypothetical protein
VRTVAVFFAVFQRDPGDFVWDRRNLEAQFVQKTTDNARELQLRFSWVHRRRSGENQGSMSLDGKLHDW